VHTVGIRIRCLRISAEDAPRLRGALRLHTCNVVWVAQQHREMPPGSLVRSHGVHGPSSTHVRLQCSNAQSGAIQYCLLHAGTAPRKMPGKSDRRKTALLASPRTHERRDVITDACPVSSAGGPLRVRALYTLPLRLHPYTVLLRSASGLVHLGLRCLVAKGARLPSRPCPRHSPAAPPSRPSAPPVPHSGAVSLRPATRRGEMGGRGG
jgi:hypothetical protein